MPWADFDNIAGAPLDVLAAAQAQLEDRGTDAARVEAVAVKRVSVLRCKYVLSRATVPALDTASNSPINPTDSVVSLDRREIRSQAH